MFESHVTIEPMDREQFKNLCQKLGVKPVIIENDSGSEHKIQMMTAKFHKTDDENQALREMHTIADQLFSVIRRKLEKIGVKNSNSRSIYVETHSKFQISQDKIEIFEDLVKEVGGHVSKNALKGESFRFATTRDPKLHEKLLERLKDFHLINTIHEQVIFDDNQSLDSRWECMECPLKRKR